MRTREVAREIADVINGKSNMDSISVWKAGRGLDCQYGLLFSNDETEVVHFRTNFFVNTSDLRKIWHRNAAGVSYATYHQTVKSVVEYLNR